MSSLLSFIAQPVTRTFIVTQDTGNSEYGAAYFTEANINTWYEDNMDNITKISKGFYIITGTFSDVIGDLSSSGSFDRKRSLLDMGKEIIIGNKEQSRLLVLRKVQEAAPPADGGNGTVGYIVVESNYRSANWNTTPSNSILSVNVARA